MSRMRLSVCFVAALFGCGDDASAPTDAPSDTRQPSDNEITSFRFLAADNPALAGDVTATITGTEITATARFAVTLADLKATFTTTGASVSVNGQPQTSGLTANTFSVTTPVVYTVTAEDGSIRTYDVRVAAPSFRPKVDFATGISVASVTSADLNGDGKPDLVVTNQTPPSMSVLLDTTPTGATTPTFAKTDFTTASTPGYLAIADINGDGKLDVAVTSSTPGSVGVFINTTVTGAATPTFATRRDFPANQNTFGVVIADLNGDGKPDLATLNGGSPGATSVFLNDTPAGGTSALLATKVDFAVGATPTTIATGDVNADGKPDLVVAHIGLMRPVLALINTTATGSAAPTFAANHEILSGQNTDGAALGDLNGDGKIDLVVRDANPAGALVFLNTSASGATPPTFAAPMIFATGGGPSGLGFGDIDGDGKVDLAATTSASTVAMLLGTTATSATTPSFRPKREYETTSIGTSVALGDFNGDGKPDLAVSNSTAGTVSVLLAE